MSASIIDKIDAYYQDPANLADLAEKQDLFIAGMRRTGVVLRACEDADISRQLAYQWRALYPDFRLRWDDAKSDANDKVKSSLFNMATSEKNVVATIYWLKNNCPEYKDRITVDVQAIQGEIEDRLSELAGTATTAGSQPATLNAKSIIDEVIHGPLALQLASPTSTNDE